MQNLKYACRHLLKSPGYTLTVVLTLAFGIAVNTQIFSLVSVFFLQPMPVRDAGRLVTIVQRSDVINLPYQLSFRDFQDIRAGSKALDDHVAYVSMPAHLGLPGHPPQRIWVEAVTPNAFDRLGVSVQLGRPLQPADGETPPAAPVAVITASYWKNHLGSDPAVIGRSILIDGKSFTIVGVAQPGFESFSYALSVGAFVPSGAITLLRSDGDAVFKYRGMSLWNVLAYLHPGSSLAAANAELGVFARRLAKESPEEHRGSRFQAVLEQRARPAPALTDFTPVFAVVFTGLVTLVLVIACANVANLMGARALSREKELVVRAALGATRGRLLRQLLVESLLFALLAGIVGFGLSVWGAPLLEQLAPKGDIPLRSFDGPDWRVWAFAAAVSLVAGLGAGLLPALRASRVDLNEGLKQGASQAGGGRRHRLRNLLVIGQVALSCVVLVASALFVRGLAACRALNLGFRPDHIALLSLDLGLQGYDEARGLRFEQDVLERVRALPGVQSANFAQHIPFSNNIAIRDTYPDAPTGHVPDGHTTVAYSGVTPGFLHDFGVPLLRGRDLAPTDDEKAPHVAVINEKMAQMFWPGKDPIGQHFRRDWAGGLPIEVVGVVPTGKYIMLTEDARPYYYVPFAQAYAMPATLVVRTAHDPHAIAASLRATVGAVDPDLPVYNQTTLDDHLSTSMFALMPLRMGAMMAGIQGGLGLLLAILGLYAVVSYSVTCRTREIGVRMALGATRADVLRLVSREGLRLTLTGLVLGILLSLLLSAALSRVVFGVQAIDPVALPATILILLITAAFACWLPARRATRVDPNVALRAE